MKSNYTFGQRCVVADMASGETKYTDIQALTAAGIIQEHFAHWIGDGEEVFTDIRSCYSGGPCGPFTIPGAMVSGALTAILEAEKGKGNYKWFRNVDFTADDVEEQLLAAFP
jgi:hypothetical protein